MMDEPDPLALIRTRTAELVARQLRSSSAVVARLRTRIEEANRLGHPHRAIHAAMVAGGLRTGWDGYQRSLSRARKAARAGGVADATPDSPGADVPAHRSDPPASPDGGYTRATHALDALARARTVASRDYARVARDLYRKERP